MMIYLNITLISLPSKNY